MEEKKLLSSLTTDLKQRRKLQHVLTHYNGDRIFLVYYDSNNAYVYRKDPNIRHRAYDKDPKIFSVLVKSYENVDYIWIPDSYSNETKYEPKEFGHGNSVLINISEEKNKYAYIGGEVYEFTTSDDDFIEEYYSDIGRNDIPYPVAVGQKYAYFMMDHSYIPKTMFKPNIVWHDAYMEYYGFSDDPWYKNTHGDTWNGMAFAETLLNIDKICEVL